MSEVSSPLIENLSHNRPKAPIGSIYLVNLPACIHINMSITTPHPELIDLPPKHLIVNVKNLINWHFKACVT